jgi:hypothetical protein
MPVRSAVRLTVAGVVPAALLLAGCGSSSSSSAPSSAAAVPAASICTQVADVLGDGPDPDADPVGYAEAQIGPLAALHPSNPALRSDVTALDAAFRQEFAHGATHATKAAVRAGQHSVNAVCPGAAS